VTLSLRRIVVAELRRLGADTVYVTENGGRKHPRVVAQFNGRTLETVDVPDRCHVRNNYISATRRQVRKFLAGSRPR
jgi:hypothetical protein